MGLEKKNFSLIGRPKHKENDSPHTGFDTNFMVDHRLVINNEKTHLVVMEPKGWHLKGPTLMGEKCMVL